MIEALKYSPKYFMCEDDSTAIRLRFWSATEFYLYVRPMYDCSFASFGKRHHSSALNGKIRLLTQKLGDNACSLSCA